MNGWGILSDGRMKSEGGRVDRCGFGSPPLSERLGTEMYDVS